MYQNSTLEWKLHNNPTYFSQELTQLKMAWTEKKNKKIIAKNIKKWSWLKLLSYY